MDDLKDLEAVVHPALLAPRRWRKPAQASEASVSALSESTEESLLDALATFLLAFAKESANIEFACSDFLRTPGVPEFPFPISALSAIFTRGVTVESLAHAFRELGEESYRPSEHELRLISSYYNSREQERSSSSAGAAACNTVYSTFLSHSVSAAEYLAGSCNSNGSAKLALAKAEEAAAAVLQSARKSSTALEQPLDDFDIAAKFLRALWQQGKVLKKIDEMKEELSASHLNFHVPTLFRILVKAGEGSGASASTAANDRYHVSSSHTIQHTPSRVCRPAT